MAKGKKKRQPLTRERVLDAALAYADEHGIENLSMRKLGELLGVEAMSLYKHVANKDEILDGLVDRVAGEIELPSGEGKWKEAMRRRAISAHAVLLRHRWATMLIVSRASAGPCMLRYVDATLGCLRRAGFSFAAADHAWNAIDSYVYGFTLQRLNFPFQPGEYAAAAASYLPFIPEEQFPHMYGLSKQVADGVHDGVNHMEFGLDLLLDGLERSLRKR